MRILCLVMLAGSVQAQTLGVFAPTAIPNVDPPTTETVLTETCATPKQPETIAPSDYPSEVRWDDTNPAFDCWAPFTAALSPQPGGYRAALKLPGTLFGPLSSVFLAAQATTSIIADQPFTVTAPHDCKHATAYRLYIDDVKAGADLPPSACSSGTVTATASGVSAGSHTVAIAAVDPVSEKRGPNLPIQANPPETVAPGAPSVVQP